MFPITTDPDVFLQCLHVVDDDGSLPRNVRIRRWDTTVRVGKHRPPYSINTRSMNLQPQYLSFHRKLHAMPNLIPRPRNVQKPNLKQRLHSDEERQEWGNVTVCLWSFTLDSTDICFSSTFALSPLSIFNMDTNSQIRMRMPWA